jgi:hypothetical protein
MAWCQRSWKRNPAKGLLTFLRSVLHSGFVQPSEGHWLLAKSLIVKCCYGKSWLGNFLIHDCMRDQDMTAASMRQFCEESELECVLQETVP